jgi:hypothetical protein
VNLDHGSNLRELPGTNSDVERVTGTPELTGPAHTVKVTGHRGESMRLTREVRQRLLDQNEGFTDSISYRAKNFSENRYYEIRGGQLYVRATGKTSWADSRHDVEFVADDEQTHRFLRDHLHALNTDGLD